MYPWFWLWAPQIQLPWSGDVLQDIDPTTNWFFGSIKPEAGNGRIEKRAFDVASYGKQLGLLTEVLIEVAEQSLDGKAASAKSLEELKRIQAEIETIKEIEYDKDLLELQQRIAAVQRRGGRRSAALSRSLRGSADA